MCEIVHNNKASHQWIIWYDRKRMTKKKRTERLTAMCVHFVLFLYLQFLNARTLPKARKPLV